MLTRAKDLRARQTEAENKLWAILRNRGLAGLKFRRQATVGPFIADFLCADAGLIVEVDGGQHAGVGMAKDVRRSAALERRGYRVVRFWNGDVLGNLSGVCDAILAAAPPSPQPSPPGGRGSALRAPKGTSAA